MATGVHPDPMFWKAKPPSSKYDSAVERGDVDDQSVQPASPSRIKPENRDLPVHEGDWLKDVAVQGARAYVVPGSCRLSGNILTSRPIVVRGDFSGGRLESPRVTVLPGASLGAAVRAQIVDVQGAIVGDVEASTLVEVSAAGAVSGRIQSPAIRVAPGAAILGASFVVGEK